MHFGQIILWGFVATVALSTLMAGSRAIGFSRMDITFMLGTMVTPDRDRAKVYGFILHFANGWLFAILYGLIIDSLGFSSWWLGMILGFGHAMVVLVALIPLLPGIHPRMVSDFAGPEPTRQLEPPGFMALNYGYRTPLFTILAHVTYGLIIGSFYHP